MDTTPTNSPASTPRAQSPCSPPSPPRAPRNSPAREAPEPKKKLTFEEKVFKIRVELEELQEKATISMETVPWPANPFYERIVTRNNYRKRIELWTARLLESEIKRDELQPIERMINEHRTWLDSA